MTSIIIEPFGMYKRSQSDKSLYKIDSSTEIKGRYVLFNLKVDKEVIPFVRYSRDGELAHLGILGHSIQELAEHLNLNVRDIDLYQSHHGEAISLIKNDQLECMVIGGGFIETKGLKGLELKGRSKNVTPDSTNQTFIHIESAEPIIKYIKNANLDLNIDVEGYEQIGNERLKYLSSFLRKVRNIGKEYVLENKQDYWIKEATKEDLDVFLEKLVKEEERKRTELKNFLNL